MDDLQSATAELVECKSEFERFLETMIEAAKKAKAFVNITISIDGRDDDGVPAAE